MNEHYILALASQPVGQVLLRQADRAFLLLQRSLEASDPAGDLETAKSSSVVEAKAECIPRWSLSSAASLLEKAGHAGANLRLKLLKSVNPETTSKVANFFKERRENIEALKLKGLQHMEENSEVTLGNHKVTRLLLWPLANLISYMNSIARPYVSPAAEKTLVKAEVSQDAAGGSPDDSIVSWKTSTEEHAGTDNEHEEATESSPNSAEEAAATAAAQVETEKRTLFEVFHFKAKVADNHAQ